MQTVTVVCISGSTIDRVRKCVGDCKLEGEAVSNTER